MSSSTPPYPATPPIKYVLSSLLSPPLPSGQLTRTHARRRPLVNSPQIASSQLLNPLPLPLRLYSWPFMAAYPALFALYWRQESYDLYFQAQEWTVLYFLGMFGVQSLIWLGCHWSMGWRAWITGIKVGRRSADCGARGERGGGEGGTEGLMRVGLLGFES